MANESEKYIFEVEARTEKAMAKLTEMHKMLNQMQRIQSKAMDEFDTTTQKDMDKGIRNTARMTREYRRELESLRKLQVSIREEQANIARTGSFSPNTIRQLVGNRRYAQMTKGMDKKEAEAKVQAEFQLDDREIEKLNRFFSAIPSQIDKISNTLSQTYTQSHQSAMRIMKELSEYQQNYSKNFKHIFESNDVWNLPRDYKTVRRPMVDDQGEVVRRRNERGEMEPVMIEERVLDNTRARAIVDAMTKDEDGVTSKLNEVERQIKAAERMDKRNESLSRRGVASDYLSHQQFSNLQADFQKSQSEFVRDREINKVLLTDLGQERTRISNEIKSMEANPREEERGRRVALQGTLKAIDEEIEAREKLEQTLRETIKNMERHYGRVLEGRDGRGTEIKPERGTFRGMIYERAPSVGLALGGALGLAFGGLFQKGASVNQSMRDDVISIGQRTGQTDWRSGVRDQAFDSGMANYLGLTGQEMLNFQNAYLSNRGFQDLDDLHTAATSQAEFSRVTGLRPEAVAEQFGQLFDNARLVGSDVADIQAAFVGGIKQSGMQGREEEQLSALNSLVQSVGQGRVVGQGEVMHLMGLQSLLNQSGHESLRGSSGTELLSSLNDGLRGGIDDPMTRAIFGMGNQFQGLGGYFELAQQLERGISDMANVQLIGDFATAYAGRGASEDEVNAVAYQFMRGVLGTDVTTEQAQGFMDLYRSGQLTQENIDRLLEAQTAEGTDEAAKRLENYQGQAEALAEQSEATTERQAAQLNDFADYLKMANNGLGHFHPAIYAAVVALGALAAAAAGTAGSFWIGERIRGRAAKRASKTNTPPIVDSKGNPIGGGKGDGGGKKGISGWFSRTAQSYKDGGGAKGLFTRIGKKYGGPGPGGAGILPGNGPGGGFGRGLGDMAGRLMLPLAIMSGVGDIAGADAGSKGQVAGEVAGGLGGAWGGASIGATIGTAVLPGVGTVIGSLAGSLLGGNIGSSIGGWIGDKASGVGDWFKGLFSPSEASAASSQGFDTKEQVDRENTNKKSQTENKRGDNISEEQMILNRQERLITQARNVLMMARSQNGIFGSMSGGMGMSESAQILSGNSNAEKIWNFFAQKGFSPQGIAGIMGNLQQESGLDPTATNASSGAYGIAQWLGSRKTGLQNFAQSRGMDMSSLDTQLEYLWHELNGGDGRSAKALDKLKNATSVRKATDIFESEFERSGGSAMDKRRSYADKFYNQFRVDSNINVTVTGDQTVSGQLNDSSEMRRAAETIQARIYDSMRYHQYEHRRT